MIRLAIALTDSERADAYRSAARRLRNVALADQIAESNAIVTDDHEEAWKAAHADRHVLLESATDISGPRLMEIAEACRMAERCIMPAHVWRFRPSVRAVRDALEAGKLGAPGLLRIHRWENGAGTRSVSSAQLISEIDLTNWFFAGPPREIHALARDDYLQVHLGFADGGMALVDHAVLPAGTGYYSLSLIGSTGAAYADDHRDLHLLYAGGAPSALGKRDGGLHVLGQLDEFASAIRAERQPSVKMEETVAALDVLDGVTSAARERRVARSTSGGSYELEG